MGSDDLFKKRKAARKARAHELRNPRVGSYLIVAEGAKTEPAYFKQLGEAIAGAFGGVVDVQVEGEGRGTVALVEKAAQIASKSPRIFEHVWVVFDKDDFEDFDEAIKLAESRGFEVAWSNQAFEYWFFLHFDYSDAALHRDDWVEKIDKLFKERGVRDGGYEKNLENIYQLVTEYGDSALAIKSARTMHKRWEQRGAAPSKCDPCTTVYQLVEQLWSYADEWDTN